MKKIITSLLVFVLLFNFISPTMIVYAEEPDLPDTSDRGLKSNVVMGNEAMADLVESGTVSRRQGAGTKVTLAVGTGFISLIGMITGILARLINIIIIQVDVIMGVLTASTVTSPEYENTAETEFFFTIDRCVFNRISLFNINYFDTEATYDVGDAVVEANESNNEIKKSITTVYHICRILAMIISLLVLIYIGIRMALSTVSSEQAKFKKMLMAWIESIIILFITVYVMVAIIEFGELLTGVFYDIRCQLLEENEKYGIFENTIRETTFGPLFLYSGLQLTIWSMIYWVLLFQEIKFFWLYIKRLLMVGLLIIVSPLIIITYSIDKAGDGKAQVFSAWVKEFLVNVLIQPLHALIYMIFVLTANALATESPLVGIMLLLAMGSVERMVKVVFDMKGLTTLRGVDKFMKKG